MKHLAAFLFLAVPLVFPGSPLSAAPEIGAVKPEKHKPALTIDASPLAQGARVGAVLSYADVIEPVQKAVVSVYSTKIVRSRTQVPPMLKQFLGEPPEREQKQEGLGSGVIITPDGYILTNNHVVEGADELKVLFSDDREFIAKVIGADPKTDVAVIKIEAENLPVVVLADSDKIRVGDIVFALGNPLGVGQTVTMGIVSAVGRNNLNLLDGGLGYESFIQTDAAINMGNSGGALVDARGRLIGINTAIVSPSRGNIGIGFAIPVNIASSIMVSLVENGGVVHRGLLGIAPGSLTGELAVAMGLSKDQKGVVVNALSPEDGPAAKAGIHREDVIVAINGKSVASLQDLRLMISQIAPDTRVKVQVLRAGKEQTFEVVLGTLGEDANAELLKGVKVVPLDPELKKQLDIDRRVEGLLVQQVEEDSPYAERLAQNLVIIEIDRTPVNTLAGARKALTPGHHLLYVFYRGTLRYLPIVIP